MNLRDIGANQLQFDATADLNSALDSGEVRKAAPKKVSKGVDKAAVEKSGRKAFVNRRSRGADPELDAAFAEIMANAQASAGMQMGG